MSTVEKKTSLYGTMKGIIAYLNSPQEKNSLAGNLATIRNSIGKKGEDATEVWPIVFSQIPEEFLGTSSLSYEENAILTTLQLYAISQQGAAKMQIDASDSIEKSLHRLRSEKKDTSSLDRRFNTMITSNDFDEFAYHLRQLFKLGKSSSAFLVDFSALAEDLFWYQKGFDKQVCLKWAREYYRPEKKNEEA